MFHEFRNPIPVITPLGEALAIAIHDRGVEHDLEWICAQDGTGECWTWLNPDIRFKKNITLGREYISPFYDPDSMSLKENK